MIMKRIILKFDSVEVKKNAAKLIKIQVKLFNRNWRKQNMRIVSYVYQYVKLRELDDWLNYVDPNIPVPQGHLDQDQIRMLNSDFNFKNYSQFYEKLEEENDESSPHASPLKSKTESKEPPKKRIDGTYPSALEKVVSEQNVFMQMW